MESILIIIPTKNSSKYLVKLVNSLLNQTDGNWRAIFVDFDSASSHIEYLQNLCNQNSRFSIEKQIHNTGIYGAQNLGFKLCKDNEWLLFWGSDDYAFNNNVISNIRQIIKRNKSYDLIIFKGRYVEPKSGKEKSKYHFSKILNKDFKKNEYKRLLFLGFRQAHQGTLINPRINLKNLIYEEKYTLAADLNFFLASSNIKTLKSKMINLNIVEIGIGGTSRRNHIQRFKEVINIYWKYFNLFFFIPFILRYKKW